MDFQETEFAREKHRQHLFEGSRRLVVSVDFMAQLELDATQMERDVDCGKRDASLTGRSSLFGVGVPFAVRISSNVL